MDLLCHVYTLHTFTYLYTPDDDSERPKDYETSLLPKVFPLTTVSLNIRVRTNMAAFDFQNNYFKFNKLLKLTNQHHL